MAQRSPQTRLAAAFPLYRQASLLLIPLYFLSVCLSVCLSLYPTNQAGFAAPELFISKAAVFSPPGLDAGNNPEGVYEFDISDYKVRAFDFEPQGFACLSRGLACA